MRGGGGALGRSLGGIAGGPREVHGGPPQPYSPTVFAYQPKRGQFGDSVGSVFDTKYISILKHNDKVLKTVRFLN